MKMVILFFVLFVVGMAMLYLSPSYPEIILMSKTFISEKIAVSIIGLTVIVGLITFVKLLSEIGFQSS